MPAFLESKILIYAIICDIIVVQHMKHGGGRMNPSIFIPILLLFFILWILSNRRKIITAKKAIEKRKKGGNAEMIELAKRFIGKECLIYAFDSNRQFTGTIKEVVDGAILLENNGSVEVLNLDYVIRIREYPKNKNGKKKSVILD